jgi:hypothetical protein
MRDILTSPKTMIVLAALIAFGFCMGYQLRSWLSLLRHRREERHVWRQRMQRHRAVAFEPLTTDAVQPAHKFVEFRIKRLSEVATPS